MANLPVSTPEQIFVLTSAENSEEYIEYVDEMMSYELGGSYEELNTDIF